MTQDYAEAAKWYRKAARSGIDIRRCSLALFYAKGQGVKQDFAEAATWYRKAADKGDVAAEVNLASLYLRGEGVVKKRSRGRALAAQGSGKRQRLRAIDTRLIC
ncbi:MAG: tetratricopeptide repeat protein [Methylovirgula sp.]